MQRVVSRKELLNPKRSARSGTTTTDFSWTEALAAREWPLACAEEEGEEEEEEEEDLWSFELCSIERSGCR